MTADSRVGDPRPICGTDPWACFDGTDDSPAIRNVDVGIFGVLADGSCCYPSGCEYWTGKHERSRTQRPRSA